MCCLLDLNGKNKRLKLKMLRYYDIPVSTSSLTTVNRDIKGWLFDWLVNKRWTFFTFKHLSCPENTSSRHHIALHANRRSCMLGPLKPGAGSLLTNDSMTSLSISVTLFNISIIPVYIAGFFNLFQFSRCLCRFSWISWAWREILYLKYVFTEYYRINYINMPYYSITYYYIISIIVHIEEPGCDCLQMVAITTESGIIQVKFHIFYDWPDVVLCSSVFSQRSEEDP